MIAQGAWRRMFHQIREERELSSLINEILTNTDVINKAERINRLYEENKGNKNNLTGKSGNAINAMLAAFDPINNCHMVSLNHRSAFMKHFNLPISSDYDTLTIGDQIVSSNKYILDGLKNMGANGNARTLSVFCYWQKMHSLWQQQANEPNITEAMVEEHENIDTNLLDSPLEDYRFLFYMENQLEDFLIQNWENTQLGKKYDLIVEDGELVSQQYRTDIGIIDILAKDKITGQYVIIELKRDQSSDATVGQLTRYMGWIEENKSEGKLVKGVIIASKYDQKLYYAIKKVPDVEVYEYRVDFHLEPYVKK